VFYRQFNILLTFLFSLVCSLRFIYESLKSRCLSAGEIKAVVINITTQSFPHCIIGCLCLNSTLESTVKMLCLMLMTFHIKDYGLYSSAGGARCMCTSFQEISLRNIYDG